MSRIDMKCMECGGRYAETKRTHVVDMKSYLIIIRSAATRSIPTRSQRGLTRSCKT